MTITVLTYMAKKRYKIDIEGTVQGIGFRPFVYKTAIGHNISGHVLNHSNGVSIEAEGVPEEIELFINDIKTKHPPFAHIHSLTKSEIEFSGENKFKIIESKIVGKANTLISPDISICEDCLADISDPSNRRHGYAFTNCTNCGPRYTIIENLPYDRPMTAMKDFEMCSECLAEYKDPMDRRYHAQPNACPVCGPTLSLLGKDGEQVDVSDEIEAVEKQIKEGHIVAIKGLGGFHLACDPFNREAVLNLRERKKRDEKPFALMMDDIETVKKYCLLNDEEERLLSSPQRPIVLLRKKEDVNGLAQEVAPNNIYLGVMLPYTPLHYLLFQGSTKALVMTSANISDEPICFSNDEALKRLKHIADYFLMHNRDIFIRTDDSIARVMNDKPLLLRRARGYSPQPIVLQNLDNNNKEILAVGGELKNAVCLLKGNKAFISQYIGDLENSASYESFEKTVKHLESVFEIKPNLIAADIHPEYFSTKWTQEHSGNVDKHYIQHHHAHIVSCMAENDLDDDVIGIALDGTGYGPDGNIWGGEILLSSRSNYKRLGYFEYIPMPGGNAAIKNPWQMSVSYILRAYPELQTASEIKELVPSLKAIEDSKIELVMKMIAQEINSPLTSSCGRLFDAVSSIIGIKNSVSFEGQAAMELEMVASFHKDSNCYNASYPYEIKSINDYFSISYTPTIKALLEDIRQQIGPQEIALKFHITIVKALTEIIKRTTSQFAVNKIALSGGCFQNRILTEKLKKSLVKAGLDVYTHSLVPPNDGGISLGQAVIACSKN